MTNNSIQASREGNVFQRLLRGFSTSLRVQFSAVTIFMALVPLVVIAVLSGVIVSGQVQEAMTQAAFDSLTAVRENKTGQIKAYFDGHRANMAALVEMANALRHEAISKLEAVKEIKRAEIARIFQDWRNDVMDVASDPGVVAGMADLAAGFRSLRASRARSLYLGKEELEDAGDGSAYSAAHREQHGFFAGYIAIHGYKDAFLIDLAGNVVYNVHKGESFGADLTSDAYRESNLARLYQELQEAEPGQVYVADAALFAGELTMFIGAPVYSGTLQVGVLAYQLPLEQINVVIQERTGLGQTGETYLVGKVGDHNELRSDRVVKTGKIGDPKPGPDADKALSGLSGREFKIGSTGVYEISVYAPLDIPELNWAIITTASVEEIISPKAEGQVRDYFTQYKEAYGYYDVFLIDPDGYVFYTVLHEPDYQTNVLTGRYAKSNLGGLVRKILESKGPVDQVDFERYEPSQDAPAAFIGAPVVHEGEVKLIVAAQLPLDQISEVMQETAGLGQTGETYLVGPNKLWRSDSRFLRQLKVDTTVLNEATPVDTLASRNALAGESGTQIIEDYRGVSVLSSWDSFLIHEPDVTDPQGLRWAVIAEIDESEALATVGEMTRFIASLTVTLVLVVGLIALLVGAFVANNLVRPVLGLTESAVTIAGGNFDIDLPPATSRNEIGVLTGAFNTMTARLREMIRDIQQRSEELAERTRELESSQAVTFAASERTDPGELLGLVVDLIRDQFDLYHAQMYVVDGEKKAAVLRESTGYAGSQLLQRKHHIPLDRPALVTKAIREGEPVLVADVSQDPSFLPNPLLPETQSELVVPLKLGGRVIGALDVQDLTPGRFSESTVTLFRTMTDQIALLFENSELIERASSQAEALTIFTTQLRTAADIAGQLGAILDPERLLQQVVELIQSRFGLYHAHVYVLDEPGGDGQGRNLVVRAGSGEVGRVLRERGHSIPFDREKSLVARAARERQAVVVDDTSLVSDFMPNPLLPQTRSEMSVPLVFGDRMLGVLDVQDDQPGRFTQAEVDTFSTLAGQVATALQNASLFERVEASAQEAQVRFEVSQALAGAQTEDEVMDVLVQQAGIYPEAQVSFSLYDPEAEVPTLVVKSASSFESGIAPVEIGSRFPASQFTVLNLLSPGESLVMSNLATDERMDPATGQYLAGLGNVSLLAIVMAVGGEEFGILRAGSPQEGFFDERKVHLYQTLAEQGAAALHAARLRAAAREREEQFRTMIENAPEGIFVYDVETNRFTDANENIVQLFGYEREELFKMGPVDVSPPVQPDGTPSAEIAIARIQEAVEGGVPVFEYTHRNAAGEEFPCEIRLVRLPAAGRVLLRASITDITERKRAEAERKRFTTQLSTAADITEQISAVLDPDELLETVILLLKERYGLYYAHYYTLDEVGGVLRLRAGYGEPGQVMLERGHSIPLDREVSLVARAAREGGIVVVHDVTEDPGFLPNPLLPDTRSEVAVPAVSGGRVLGVFDVQHDEAHYFTQGDLDVFSTLARQVAIALQNAGLFEELQVTAERLREADQLKSEFLASMSHDLRTPLNSIIGYAEVMLMGLEGELDPETMEDVQAIYDNGQHLLHLINDLLDLTKIEAGHLALDVEEVDVEVLLDEVKSNNIGLLHKTRKPIDFEVIIEGELPFVRADRIRLSQVLNNLVSNAVKFTEEGHIYLRASQDNGWVCIEVEDTGVGISEEDQEKVFDKFRQVGSKARRAEGTGLGLAIARFLVEMHGGTVTLRSELGKGSTFIIRLPVQAPD